MAFYLQIATSLETIFEISHELKWFKVIVVMWLHMTLQVCVIIGLGNGL